MPRFNVYFSNRNVIKRIEKVQKFIGADGVCEVIRRATYEFLRRQLNRLKRESLKRR